MPRVTLDAAMSSKILIEAFLEARIDPDARAWLAEASDAIHAGVDVSRFGQLLSLASRKLGHGARRPWSLSADELQQAETLVPGWNPERWTALEAARVALVLSRADLTEPTAATAIEAAFRFADEGELCALYRSLAHLPNPQAYRWRAAEGCRTNMVTVFEADVLDTPYPALHFDAIAFDQAVIKALFVGAPLWRLWGLDRRLSPELARMALDLCDERRSAHRPIPPELWLCLGSFGEQRGLDAIEVELAPFLAADALGDDADERMPGARAAVLALGRAGASARLRELEASAPGPLAREAARALAGDAHQTTWRELVAPVPA